MPSTLEAQAALPASDLVERCRRGERKAFRELYDAHHRQVASQLSRMVPRADVSDVVQEVFVEVFRSISRFEGRSAFSTWLFRLAMNMAMKHRRKSARPEHAPHADGADSADPDADPSGELFARERCARAEALLDTLAPKKRVALVLHDVHGMDAAQIAEATGSNVLTVRTRLFYARREFERLASSDPALAEYFQSESEVRP